METEFVTFEVKISEKDILSAINAMSDWFGIELTREQFIELLNQSEDALCEMIRFGPTDTESRSMYVNTLLKTKLGMTLEWPINGDSQKYKESFYTEFILKCKECDVKLADEFSQ